MNKLIIFDCFGVIFDEIAPVLFSRYLPEDRAAAVKDKIFVPADKGQLTYEQIFEKISEELGISKDSVRKEWDELINLRHEIIPVIENLRKTADIALLSNAPLGFVEMLFDRYGLASLFDRTVISCNVKMAKPDPEIYRYCVSLFNKEYDEIYMIDDNIKNLAHLSELGITPILFTDTETLIKDMNIQFSD